MEIYNKAKLAGDVIISKDSDLVDIVKRFGSPLKVISISIGNADNRKLYNFLQGRIENAVRLLTQFKISFIRLTNEP